MARHRSSIKGAASFRRLIRALPDSANVRLVALLNRAGPVLAAVMRDRLGTRTGRLGAQIGWRVSPKTLNLKVGLLTKKANRDLYYGHILSVGRKAQTVTAHRHVSSGTVSTYLIRVRARAGAHVESRGLFDFRHDYLNDYRGLMNDILADAARGAGDD